mgnify:CR=1 FL=1
MSELTNNTKILKKIKWFSDYLSEVLSYEEKNHQTTLTSLNNLIDIYIENKNEPVSEYFDYYAWDDNHDYHSSSSECEELSDSSEYPPEYELQQLDPRVRYNNQDTSGSEDSDTESESDIDYNNDLYDIQDQINLYHDKIKYENYQNWISNSNIIKI